MKYKIIAVRPYIYLIVNKMYNLTEFKSSIIDVVEGRSIFSKIT